LRVTLHPSSKLGRSLPEGILVKEETIEAIQGDPSPKVKEERIEAIQGDVAQIA
jgi:hypothetical protein